MTSYAFLGPPRTSQDLPGPQFHCKILIQIRVKIKRIREILGNPSPRAPVDRAKTPSRQETALGRVLGSWSPAAPPSQTLMQPSTGQRGVGNNVSHPTRGVTFTPRISLTFGGGQNGTSLKATMSQTKMFSPGTNVSTKRCEVSSSRT